LWRHQQAAVRSQSRSEQAIGDANLTFHPGLRGNHFDDPLSHRGFAAEVPGWTAGRQRDQPRMHHLHTGCQTLHRGDHRLEHPSIPIRVIGEHNQLWAAALRFPAALATLHSLRPSRR
jgi:hypothetical protein